MHTYNVALAVYQRRTLHDRNVIFPPEMICTRFDLISNQ